MDVMDYKMDIMDYKMEIMDRTNKIEQNRYKWISRKDKMDIIDNYRIVAKKISNLWGVAKEKN
jgi:hypothetical protein